MSRMFAQRQRRRILGMPPRRHDSPAAAREVILGALGPVLGWAAAERMRRSGRKRSG